MKQDQLQISVILPVKDGDFSLLRRALQSALDQTYSSFEILLIDDGSRKEYSEKLDQLAGADDRIRLFHISPSGVSGARNFAVTKAQGDIITYLDSDDALHPCCFEEAVWFFQDPEIDAVWGGTCFLTEEEMTRAVEQQKNTSPHTPEELQKLSVPLTPERIHQTRAECIGEPFRFEGGGYINRGIAARFIRKEAFADGKTQFPPGLKLYEDTIWNLEMMTSLRILYVKSIWYDYYDNSASASNRFHPDILSWMEAALDRIRGLLDLSDPTEYAAYTRFLMDSLRYVFRCFYGHPDWKPTRSERNKIKDHLYASDPWKEIGSPAFMNAAEERDRKKVTLYRKRLLLFVWKATWK